MKNQWAKFEKIKRIMGWSDFDRKCISYSKMQCLIAI